MLNKILPYLNDCVLAWDIDHHEYVFISPNIKAVTGYDAQDFIQQKVSLAAIINQNDYADMKPLIEALEIESCAEFNYRILTAQYKLKWLNEKRTLFVDNETGRRIVLSVIKDTSDRRSVNFRIKEALGDFSLLFDKNPNPMWIYEMPSLRILKVNEAAVSHYGYSTDEFLSMTIRDLRPRVDLALFNKYVYQKGFSGPETKANGFNTAGVWRHQNKQGDIIYAEITGHEVKYGNTICRIVVATDVTERIHYQEEVKRREKFLTSLIDSQTTYLTRVNNEGKFTFVNTRFLTALDYEPNELTGNHFNKVVLPAEESVCQEIFLSCLQNPGKVVSLVHQLKDKAGDVRWTEWEFIGIADDNGRVTEVQGVGLDVHERIIHEQEARAAAQKLNDFIESITDAFFILDNDGKLLRVNGAFERLAQKNRNEVLGRVLWDEFPLIKRKAFTDAVDRAIIKQQSVQFSEYFPGIDRWFSAIIYPSAEGLTFFIRDITSKRKAQHDLISTKNNLEALINNTKDSIWAIDRNYKIVTLNNAYRERMRMYTGVDLQEGDDIHYKRSSQYIEEWNNYFKRAFDGERYRVRRESTIPHTGEKVYHEIGFNPIYNSQGEITGVGCFSRDVTNQIQAEQAIMQQNEHLAKIASLSSHELRRPVASLLGLINLLDKDNPNNPENQQIIEFIHTSAKEIDEVIHLIVDKTFVSSRDKNGA